MAKWDSTQPKPLSAAELAEALRLVAAELDALGTHPRHPHRWGQLKAHLDGLQDPSLAASALAVLRRRAAAEEGGMTVLDLGAEPPLVTRPHDWPGKDQP